MRIGAFTLWIWFTILVGGAFVFGQINNLQQDSDIAVTSSKSNAEDSRVWSQNEFDKLIQNSPFQLVLPDENLLSRNTITGVFITSASVGEYQIEINYETSEGLVQIVQTNMTEEQYISSEIVPVNKNQWENSKEIKHYITIINGIIVSVSGQVPKEQWENIISSLNS
jgi:hypothetical protein